MNYKYQLWNWSLTSLTVVGQTTFNSKDSNLMVIGELPMLIQSIFLKRIFKSYCTGSQ